MGVTRTVYDWLGKRLSGTGPDEMSGWFEDAQRVAMTKAAFRTAVSYIGAAIGKSEFKVYQNGKLVPNDWNSYLWTVSPNINDGSTKFINDLLWDVFSSGKGIVVPQGKCIYLAAPMEPSEPHAFGDDVYSNVTVRNETLPGSYLSSELFIFRMGNPNVGHLVSTMGEQYGALIQTASSMFRDRNGKKYKMKYSSTKTGNEEDRAKFEEYNQKQLKNFMSADAAVLPEFEGMSLEPFNQNAASGLSSDFINLRKDCFEAVATAMKMPTSMMYGNVNNFKEVFKSFITFAVAPVADMMETEITRKIFTDKEWELGSRVKIDISNIKYTDLFDAANSSDKLIGSSLMTPDEVLTYLGLDPTGEPWAKRHYLTKNYSLASERASEGGEQNE